MKDSLDHTNSTAPEGSSYLLHWPDVVAPLIKAVNTDEFGDVFFDSVNRIAPIDSALMLLFRADQKPLVLYQRLHPAEQASFNDVYLAGAYLLSPLYRRFQSLRSGFYRLGSLEHQAFEQSDFGIAYFNQSGLCDDANFLLKLDHQSAIVASFGRQQLITPFSAQELQQLHIADPVYRSALEKHWGAGELPVVSNLAKSGRAHNTLKLALKNFGSSVLTEREHTVLQLMLDGNPSKTSARELGISVDTERGHRKNIYVKLKVASQAQLFSLVFSVLSEVSLEAVSDPYRAYIDLDSKN